MGEKRLKSLMAFSFSQINNSLVVFLLTFYYRSFQILYTKVEVTV